MFVRKERGRDLGGDMNDDAMGLGAVAFVWQAETQIPRTKSLSRKTETGPCEIPQRCSPG